MEEARMTGEERGLLLKAAADPKGRIAIKHGRSEQPDRERLAALFRSGYLEWLGEIMGPHIGGTFTVWQIAPAGRANADLSDYSIAREGGIGRGSQGRWRVIHRDREIDHGP